MINRTEYMKYLANASSSASSDLELIKDINELVRFERTSNKELGIIPNQPYYDIVLNLYRNRKTGRVFRYPAFIYGNKGVAIIITLNTAEGKFVLLEKHYREFHHQYTLEICRGYGSLDSELMSARIELEEEISLTLSYKDKLQLLGEIYPDSGINNNIVSIFSLDLKGKFTPHANDAEEQIDGFEFMDYNKFKQAIKDGIIKDGFTISAFALYALHFGL